jgi:UDP-4-amino-4,6-dideoxy-N-acetyl-beta-L-altrosamine N-acetyltransferase
MLKFRRITINDLEKLRMWRMLPEVTKFLLTDPIITKEEQKRWYESIKDGKKYKCWIINYNEVDIGFANLVDIDDVNKRADPGLFICEKRFKGIGLPKHIYMNLMKYAFEDLNLHKLYGPIISENAPTVAVCLQFGFKIEGYFKDHIFKNGRFWDLVMVAIDKEAWFAIKKRTKYIEGIFEKY